MERDVGHRSRSPPLGEVLQRLDEVARVERERPAGRRPLQRADHQRQRPSEHEREQVHRAPAEQRDQRGSLDGHAEPLVQPEQHQRHRPDVEQPVEHLAEIGREREEAEHQRRLGERDHRDRRDEVEVADAERVGEHERDGGADERADEVDRPHQRQAEREAPPPHPVEEEHDPVADRLAHPGEIDDEEHEVVPTPRADPGEGGGVEAHRVDAERRRVGQRGERRAKRPEHQQGSNAPARDASGRPQVLLTPQQISDDAAGGSRQDRHRPFLLLCRCPRGSQRPDANPGDRHDEGYRENEDGDLAEQAHPPFRNRLLSFDGDLETMLRWRLVEVYRVQRPMISVCRVRCLVRPGRPSSRGACPRQRRDRAAGPSGGSRSCWSRTRPRSCRSRC